MKKHYLAALAVTAMLGLGASGTALAANSGTFLDGSGIAGSPHDFTDNISFGAADGTGTVTNEQWNFRKEICRVCHSPHDKQRDAYTAGLLWNRNMSSEQYETYVMSEKRAPGAIGQPQGRAKMCLSCHDNTVALGQFDTYANGGLDIEATDNTATTDVNEAANNKTDGNLTMQEIYDDGHFMIGNSADGRSLKGTHPISVLYSTGYKLNPVTNAMGPSSGTIANVLDNGMVQCSSCHDVHNRVSVPGTHLLRQSNSVTGPAGASGLCLTCHDK